MEDEAEIYDGLRANFPLTFGKQTKSETPLELIHSTTRRTSGAGADDGQAPSASSSGDKSKAFPSLSSSSKSWLDSFKKVDPRVPQNPNPNPNPNSKKSVENSRLIGPTRQPMGQAEVEDDDEGVIIGPPRPSVEAQEEDEDGPIIGPPRPLPSIDEEDEEDDGLMIGPPRPPPGSVGSDSEQEMDEGEEENRHRIPQSNEIVLKGHTKV